MTTEAHHRTNVSAKRVELEERRTRVAAMLLAKVEQREIARREGVALGTICNDVIVIKAQWRKEYAESYDAIVSRELAKLDLLERGCAAAAFLGDKDARDGMLKIADRRARLLGLDKPHKIDATVKHTTELDEAIEELLDQFPTAADA